MEGDLRLNGHCRVGRRAHCYYDISFDFPQFIWKKLLLDSKQNGNTSLDGLVRERSSLATTTNCGVIHQTNNSHMAYYNEYTLLMFITGLAHLGELSVITGVMSR